MSSTASINSLTMSSQAARSRSAAQESRTQGRAIRETISAPASIVSPDAVVADKSSMSTQPPSSRTSAAPNHAATVRVKRPLASLNSSKLAMRLGNARQHRLNVVHSCNLSSALRTRAFIASLIYLFSIPMIAAAGPTPTVSQLANTTPAACTDAASSVSSIFSDMTQMYESFAQETAIGVGLQHVEMPLKPCPFNVSERECNGLSSIPQVPKEQGKGSWYLSNHKMPPREPCVLEAELRAECVLWDSSCTGDLEEAKNRFFQYDGTRKFLMEHRSIDKDSKKWSLNPPYDTPGLSNILQKIKAWSDTPKCDPVMQDIRAKSRQRFIDARNRRPGAVPNPDGTYSENIDGSQCCGIGGIHAGNVDILYWPEPDADTSCLDIVGGEPHAIDYGASTDAEGTKYWGCIKTDTANGKTFTQTTASIATAKPSELGVSFKEYVPYMDSSWCPDGSDSPVTSKLSRRSSALSASATAYSALRIPSSGIYRNGTRPSTVVSGGFTFTSPSIYAHFTSITAYDDCRQTLIPSTMLTFTSGELSSYAGLFREKATLSAGSSWTWKDAQALTSVFNPHDLPCPPPGVANKQLYQPHPGEPYRPQLVIPQKVKTLLDWFPRLPDGAFTGFDPPRSLVPTTTLAADPNVPQDQGGAVAMPEGVPSPVAAKPTPTDQAKVAAEAMAPAATQQKGSDPVSQAEIRPAEENKDPGTEKDGGKDAVPDKTSISQASKTSAASQPAAGPQGSTPEQKLGASPWQQPLGEQQSQPQQQQKPAAGDPGAQNDQPAQSQAGTSGQSGQKADNKANDAQSNQQVSPQTGSGGSGQQPNAKVGADTPAQQSAVQKGGAESQQPTMNTPSNSDPGNKVSGNNPASQGQSTGVQAQAQQPQQQQQQTANVVANPQNPQTQSANNVVPATGGQQKPAEKSQAGPTNAQPQGQGQPAVNGQTAAAPQQAAPQSPQNGQVQASSQGDVQAPSLGQLISQGLQPGSQNEVQNAASGNPAGGGAGSGSTSQNIGNAGQPAGVQPAVGQPGVAANNGNGAPQSTNANTGGQSIGSQAGGNQAGTGGTNSNSGSQGIVSGSNSGDVAGTVSGQSTSNQQGSGVQQQGPVGAALNSAKAGTSGAPNVVGGGPMSAGGSVSGIVKPGVSSNIARPINSQGAASAEPKIVTINGYDLKALTGGVSIEGKTLSVGDPAITGRGSDIISLATDRLVVGSVTVMRTDAESAQSDASRSVRSTSFATTSKPIASSGVSSTRGYSNSTSTANSTSPVSSETTTRISLPSTSRTAAVSPSQTQRGGANTLAPHVKKMRPILLMFFSAEFLLILL